MNVRFSAAIAFVGLAVNAMAGQITGQLSYREKIALPPNAVITLKLEDATVAENPTLVSELRLASGGRQVPFTFQLPFIDSNIKRGRKYVLHAEIRALDQELFHTAQGIPVISNGSRKVNLVLRRVVPAVAPITDVTWKLVELGGKPSMLGTRGSPTLKFDTGNRFAGYTGVNTFSGAYRTSGTSINLNPGAQTLIGASPEMMEQEKNFTAALRDANAYRVVEGRLELLRGAEVLARFER